MVRLYDENSNTIKGSEDHEGWNTVSFRLMPIVSFPQFICISNFME